MLFIIIHYNFIIFIHYNYIIIYNKYIMLIMVLVCGMVQLGSLTQLKFGAKSHTETQGCDKVVVDGCNFGFEIVTTLLQGCDKVVTTL